MWNRTENSDSVKPAEIDTTSSNSVVYVRKNFELIPEEEERPAHWEYDEQEVKKDDWELYKSVLTNTSDISDVNDALVELANIIGA